MNLIQISICFLFLFLNLDCNSQSIQRKVINENDQFRGYYIVKETQNKPIATLVLLTGFGQRAEDLIPESKLPEEAYNNNILTIICAVGNKLYADSAVQVSLSAIFKDVIKTYKVSSKDFIIGGFSAGGMVALRYTELCNQYPDKFPIYPKAVFTVDSPIDLFKIYEDLENTLKNNYSEPAVEEARRAIAHINEEYGTPKENPEIFKALSAFNMDKSFGEPEKYLRNIAVRTYHDVDIPWRLKNRNQTVKEANFYVTSELINRLLLMGNTKAEFIQSEKKGYRSNGQRHPHSWSIVDEVECINWIKGLLR